MRLIRPLLSTLLALMLAFAAGAAVAAPLAGKDFVYVDPAQVTEPGNKVEVIEFFAYYCPHCNALDQPLADWVKKQGDNVVFKRVHTTVTGEPVPQQRLFYALQLMGREDEFHGKILSAIHFRRMRLDQDDDIIDFMVRQGLDREKFTALYHSFAVQSKVNQAVQMQANYQARSWPLIVLDGKLATSPPMVGAEMNPYDEKTAQNTMLNVMDELVAQLLQERSKQ